MCSLAACRTISRHLFVLLGFLWLTAEARAEFIISAQSVLRAPPPIGEFRFERTIDQSGLSLRYMSGVTDFDAYVALSPIHTRSNEPPNYAASFGVPPQNIDFDLGDLFTLTKLAFWNYPFRNSAGALAFEVYTSTDPNFATSFFAGLFNPIDDGTTDLNMVQAFDLADSDARYVRLRVLRSASGTATGFSEVAFGGAVIPEPSSLALACVGAVGLAGVVTRRKRKQKA